MKTDYHAFIMHVASSHGGHIGRDGKSLCGIEKRMPDYETEHDFFDDEFSEWLEKNKLQVCGSCLRIYENKIRISRDSQSTRICRRTINI